MTSLDFFSLQYQKNYQDILKSSLDQGENFVKLMTQRYGFYSGWTVINDPFGKALEDTQGGQPKHRAHIESDVLVDYREYFNLYPKKKPRFTRYSPWSGVSSMYINYNLCLERHNTGSARNATRIFNERVVVDTRVRIIEVNKYIESDQYINPTK